MKKLNKKSNNEKFNAYRMSCACYSCSCRDVAQSNTQHGSYIDAAIRGLYPW